MESASSLDVLSQALLGFGHPIRIRALVVLETEQSPKDLAVILGDPLGVVSYHVRMLRDYGLIEETRLEQRRGALAHFYRRTELAEALLGKLNGTLDVPKRKKGRQGAERREVLKQWATTNRSTSAAIAA